MKIELKPHMTQGFRKVKETRYRGMTDCTVDNSIYTKESKPSKLVTVLEISCSWLHVLSVGVG